MLYTDKLLPSLDLSVGHISVSLCGLSIVFAIYWPRGAKLKGKALERRTAPAVSAWAAPLSPLGFSASDPITGAESLAY